MAGHLACMETWLTVQEPSGAFARSWDELLAASPHANFTLSRPYLSASAREGEQAIAMLLDQGPRRAAMVLRQSGRELVCGYPWRAEAVVAGADPECAAGMSEADAEWLARSAERFAGRRRLRIYLPSRGGWPAGCTVMVRLVGRSEEEIFRDLEHGKSRRVRKCAREGYLVSDKVDLETQWAFACVVDDTHERRHGLDTPSHEADPGPGHGWRNWELPWHWLLHAWHDGSLVAGLASGRQACGHVDTRVSGSTETALRDGVNCFLLWELLRRARAAGNTWVNLGGATPFKREFGGSILSFHCHLGGGPEWLAPNLVETWMQGEGRRAAGRMAGWVSRLRRAEKQSR